jgi:hypothetical protein
MSAVNQLHLLEQTWKIQPKAESINEKLHPANDVRLPVSGV